MVAKIEWNRLHRQVREQALPGALAAGLVAVLAFGAGEAQAQALHWCPNAPPPLSIVPPEGKTEIQITEEDFRGVVPLPVPPSPTEPVQCWFSDGDGDRYVFVVNPRITTTEDYTPGIDSSHPGGGDLVIYVRSVAITSRDYGDPLHFHPLDHGRYAVRTMGSVENIEGYGLYYTTGEESHGVWADHSGEGRVGIDFRDMSLSTAGGNFAHGIYASQEGSYVWDEDSSTSRRARGAVIVNVIETERDREGRVRPIIGTRGDESDAIRAEYTRAAAYGHVVVTVEGYTIATGGIVPKGPQFTNTGEEDGQLVPSLNGYQSRGIYARHQGRGDIRVKATDSHILTWGIAAHGIFADHTGITETITNCRVATGPEELCPESQTGDTEVRTGGGAIDIDVTGGRIGTEGAGSIAIYGRHQGSMAGDAGGIAIDAAAVAIATTGEESHGILAWVRQPLADDDGERDMNTGEGDIAIAVNGGTISTEGEKAYAIWAKHEHLGDIAVTLAGGATAATTGAGSHGVFVEHQGTGDVAVTGGAISTQGAAAHGVLTRIDEDGDLTLAVRGGDISTQGEAAHGVLARLGGDGNLGLTVTGADVSTRGSGSHGIYGRLVGSGDLTLAVTGGNVDTRGEGALGVYVVGGGAGAVSVDIADDVEIAAGGVAVLVRHGPLVVRAVPPTVAGSGARSAAATPANQHEGEGAVRVTVGEGARIAGAETGISVPGGGASRTVVVHGRVEGGTGPAIYLQDGGTVTVGASGEVVAGSLSHAIVSGITGEQGAENPLTVTVEGRVEGNIVVQDDSDLKLDVVPGKGEFTGGIFTVGGGTLTFTPGTAIAGTLYNPSDPYTVEISIGRIVFEQDFNDSGGATVIVAKNGHLTGVVEEGVREAIRNDDGSLTVVLDEVERQDLPEAIGRIGGLIRKAPGIVEAGAVIRTIPGIVPRVFYQPPPDPDEDPRPVDRQPVGLADTAGAAWVDAWDVGLAREAGDRYRLRSYYAPRTRVYEALPSALLRLNRLAARDQRLAAPRAANGAWAIVEAGKGTGQAASSTTQAVASGSDYDYRRYGVRAGVEVPVSDDGLAIGVSVHHLSGSVDLAGDTGDIDAWGTGFGFSGSWESEDGTYLDGQFQATLWEAWLVSGLRGTLAAGPRGTGYAAGVEIGRRFAMGMSGLGGLSLLPRARLVHSRVDMEDFVDRVTSRSVSLEKARSTTGRAGVGVEAAPPGPDAGRLFAALELEREFSPDTRMLFAGTTLDSKAESTWVRAELGATREWEEGRYALQGRLSYAAASGDNRDYGGNVSLKLRF